MTRRWTICVVSGSRAEYGLLYWVMKELQQHPRFQLQLVATAMHLSPEFGSTVREIERDGFTVDRRVEMLLSSDSAIGIAKSVGIAAVGFADAYAELAPHAVMVLGDRFELLAAVQTAHFMRIPIVHLAGGDVTAGAFDDAVRHAITKMAHVHFVTNEQARRRVLQMGEDEAFVFNHGSPGLDGVRRVKRLSRRAIETRLQFRFRDRNLLVTYHPATLGDRSPDDECAELLQALDRLGPEFGLIFTRPNADPGGRRLIAMVDEFVRGHENACVVTSMGQPLYLSTLAQVDAVVGNSSSGLYEAPSFGIPTVNVGMRQQGRLRSASVVDCAAPAATIHRAIVRALRMDCSRTINPYGDGRAAPRIARTLAAVMPKLRTTAKVFVDRPAGASRRH